MFRLRNSATGQFLSGIRERVPVFTDHGKTHKTREHARAQRIEYNLLRALEAKPWPDLEMVTMAVVIDTVEADDTPNFDHLAKFINETQGGSHWGPVAREAKRLVARGEDFTYLIYATGEHDLRAIQPVHIHRYVDRTGYGSAQHSLVLALPDCDRDLIYAKMAMGHEIQGIWNFKTCKKL